MVEENNMQEKDQDIVASQDVTDVSDNDNVSEKDIDDEAKQDDNNPAGDEEVSLEKKVQILQEQLDTALAKVDENWNMVLHTKAEAENIKRRAERDVSSARKYALEKFVNELLPVKDSMEMGLNAAQEDDADIVKIQEGYELTIKMLGAALDKFAVKEIYPLDEKFNPEYHQAMSMQATEEKEPNTVVAVMQKGYTLNDRLVRPAMVVVSKAPE